ncbi:rRNA maturation RNase YbeY [Psychromonas sp. MME2]|uniref:rRNA maturation RNase YbeY n=1 Tax=unclassified Psychromonas TaxID=2614957 RepID=UPI00339C48B9
MRLYIDLQIATINQQSLPSLAMMQEWVSAAITAGSKSLRKRAEVTVRIVELIESQQLNNQYRAQDKPTNVLSFPFQNPPGLTLPLLGDLIICKEVVESEAIAQKKELTAHWAHMLIHGTLHLLGYDHIIDEQAEKMESIETELLIKLDFADPYLSEKSK